MMRYERIKRWFDVTLSVVLLGLCAFPMLLIMIVIKRTSVGPILFWSYRVGIDNHLFRMPKFRTMRIDTPPMATHLLKNPEAYVTSIGVFLRKTSLDELPQLISVIKGDMSIVGPRPALYNQDDLVSLRTARGIHRIPPGVTGWAQINGRDELPIPVKVGFDEYYLNRHSMAFDIKIVALTIFKVVRKEGVNH